MNSTEWQNRVPLQNPEVAWRIVDEECIIIDPQGSQATVLNPVGARIWELIDGSRSVSTIVTQILDEYAADPTQVRSDAQDFLDELHKRKLIQFQGDSAAGA